VRHNADQADRCVAADNPVRWDKPSDDLRCAGSGPCFTALL
jgi:hypothetical protein